MFNILKTNAMLETTESFFEKNATIIKVAAIGFLTLLLLIPMSMIQSLVMERRARQIEATNDISSKWGFEQRITGPILTIPYYTFDLNKENKRINIVKRFANFLPEDLRVDGEIAPEVRYRGIFQVAVYQSNLKINGHFAKPVVDIGTSNVEIDWKGAFISMGITDLRGISQAIEFAWNGDILVCEPGVIDEKLLKSGITVNNVISSPLTEKYSFSVGINLNGSKGLSFVPVGRETLVTLQSSWNNPSFDGAFLPATREVTEKGFSASWKVLELNRNYPQKWCDREVNLQNSAFGVSLILPIETYQITERSMKYAILFFSLTFITFFFVEILHRMKVHPIQYILVGFGLTLFYLLLLSLSEHIGFGWAYLLASAGIIVMISSYSHSMFYSYKLTALVAALLSVLYGFLYILLQMQDYTLLMGSIGLFIILSGLMYISRKVKWYAINDKS